MKFLKSSLVGLAAGVVNGLFGSGGGNIVVPAMRRFLGVRTHNAHATAIAVILPLSVVSGFVFSRGVRFDWTRLLLISAGGVAGGVAGALLLKKLKNKWLHIIFGLFMMAAGAVMIFR